VTAPAESDLQWFVMPGIALFPSVCFSRQSILKMVSPQSRRAIALQCLNLSFTFAIELPSIRGISIPLFNNFSVRSDHRAQK
jgi:hypothetical protein